MDKKIMVVGNEEVSKAPVLPSQLEDVTCPMAHIKRDQNESYKDFGVRRAYINNIIKKFCKGMLFHDPSEQGTYDVGRRKAKTEAKVEKRQRVKKMKAAKKNAKT